MFEKKYKPVGLEELESLIDESSKINIYTTDKHGANNRVDLKEVDNHMEPKDILKWFHFCGPEGLIRANIIVGDGNGLVKGNVILERNTDRS
ncbi:MAG: hypothetical protein WDA13_03155 [Candidatus Shapirobacteria bacterium]|jgi:hypothetical protein